MTPYDHYKSILIQKSLNYISAAKILILSVFSDVSNPLKKKKKIPVTLSLTQTMATESFFFKTYKQHINPRDETK